MRKIVLDAFGPPEVLRPVDVDDPLPPAGGYVVELRAIGINFAELVERRGLYRKDQRLPYEMGKEAAGVIVARGPEARGYELGQRVIVIRFEGGCYAERVAAEDRHLLPMPEHLDFEQGAAFAISYATAWYAQEELARVRPGESVLIQAAAGATGSAAVRLALARGCGPVIGAVGSAAKAEVVLGLGAMGCAVENGPGRTCFASLVAEATDGRGADYCLESIGGEVFERSLRALGPMGRLVLIGFSSIERDHSEAIKRVHPLQIFLRSWGLFGLNVENLDFPSRKDIWGKLVSFAEQHRLEPLLGPRFPLEEAARAHAAIESRGTTGKVILVP